MGRLFQATSFERRESLRILVATRWVLIAAALFVVLYRSGLEPSGQVAMALLLAGAALLNALLHAGIERRQPFPIVLPVAVGVFDVAAITTALVLVDGFDNPSYVLYYPALVGFSLAFSGRASVVYAAATLGAYLIASLATHGAFNRTGAGDQHTMVMRLSTMAASVLAANMIVRIERQRRERAVAAEVQRQQEVFALQRRTAELERAAEEERNRLVREVHDGISQGAYMLSLGLETTADELGRYELPEGTRQRVAALARVSKQNLLETRNLLFDLGKVMAGRESLGGLLRNHCSEFEAITGIAVELDIRGGERSPGAARVGEVYRVVQEALSNVYRHAGATRVRVTLDDVPRGFRLVVEDDGSGIGEGRTGGNGLRTMRERAERLGGSLTLEPGTPCGTRLELTIPYEDGHADTHPAG